MLWDPELQTAVAQADLETKTRRTKLHTLRFSAADGRALPIATTRPELLPGCVALYHHPDDPRFAGLSEALEPLEGRPVPVRTDEEVDPDFGTGLMMVCTFGDAEDVGRWRRDGLDTRMVIGPDGRMTELAGRYAGMSTSEARKRVVADLEAAGRYDGFTMTEQAVPTAERSGAPIEWAMAPQWFLRVLDLKERLLERSAQLRWHPPHMKARLDHWIEGLRWDWNLSRQRFYGVPIPVWLCDDCGEGVPARTEDLPLDPLETAPPLDACPACGGTLAGDPDVLDTWMTSSMTPMITANWARTEGRAPGPLPMTVRVQAFEIIRTWLFTTLLKADLHLGTLPWRDVMISGWGLNEQGRKISKRDLVGRPDGSFNRYDPDDVIDMYGADALRHWAGRSHLGHDLRYHEKDVKAGRRVVVKLWNAARLVEMALESDAEDPGPGSERRSAFDPTSAPPLAARPPEDRDLLHGLDAVIRTVDDAFADYDYATGLSALDRYFFATFCDDWLETIKARIHQPERFPAGSRASAQATAHEALRTILGLYAPYLPFVTEAIWQRLYASQEEAPSLHVTRFPEPRGVPEAPEMGDVRAVLRLARALRTESRVPQSRQLEALQLSVPAEDQARWAQLEPTLRAACRVDRIAFEPGGRPAEGRPVAVALRSADDQGEPVLLA